MGRLLILMICVLSACVSYESTLMQAPATFTTRIYDNGLKQFQLQLMVNTENQHRQTLQDKVGSKAKRQQREAVLVDRLEQRLKETGYCREGYVRATEFSSQSLDDFLIRGECMEGATDADRKVFPN